MKKPDENIIQPRTATLASSICKSAYKISKLKNVLCLGETYSVVTATEMNTELVKVEYFLLAQGLPIKLHNETTDHYAKNAIILK